MKSSSYLYDLGGAFAETAANHPQAPAIRFPNGHKVSYAQLEALADRLAKWLMKRNAGPGHVVALQNGKTLEGYAAMLACLKIGTAYTNLDVQNPRDRLGKILAVCQPALILCDDVPAPSLAEAAGENDTPVIALREYAPEIAKLDPAASEWPRRTASDPAYIMFTSGSTGIPKGAAISHGNVLNFISWVRSTFRIGPGDVVANANPIYFDNSVFDFYGALFSGACLAPIPTGGPTTATTIVRQIDDAQCTIWFSVPSLLIYLMTMKALRVDTFQSVRSIVFGGEGYPKSELAKLLELYGSRCDFYNVYGPTECTCICSAYRVTADDLRDEYGLPPLGRIADNFAYLVLEGDAPVRPGEIGELCLLGPQVGLGYYNDPERTESAFVQNPVIRTLRQRMYRTGDLVRDVDGILHFVGRKDNQIKHMGYRIELEEIEAAIGQLDYVIQTAVVYKRIRHSFGHIVAYVASGEVSIDGARLQHDLKLLLPTYMIPNRFVISGELPKNSNGKVDRARLTDV